MSAETGAADQPTYPWRGRITCDPAPGQPGSPDGFPSAATQIDAFFGIGDPDALRGCDAIGWGALDDTSRWQLLGPDGRQAEVDLRIRFSSDNLMVIREAALAGLGIARLAPAFCKHEIDQGKLCIVMPGWAPPPMSIYALYPSRRHVSNVGRLFLAALTLQFNQAFAS